jgi:hypothetical protein
VAKRNGTKPKAAMVAVSTTGVMRRFAPSRTGVVQGQPVLGDAGG